MATSYPPPMSSSRWGSRTKRIVVIGVLLVLGFILWNLRQVFPLLVAAVVLSYLLRPLVNVFERHVLIILPFRARSLAVLLAFLTVFASFAIIIVLIIPVLVNQIADASENLPDVIETVAESIEDFLNKPITISGRPILFNGKPIIPLERITEITGGGGETGGLIESENVDIAQMLGSFLGPISGLTGPAFEFVGGAFDAVINLVFLIVIVFYLARDGQQFIEEFVNIVPESYRGDVRRLLYELGQIWNAYLRGQLVLSVSIGVTVYIAALILGLPSAPILGLLSGFLEFIPTLGPFLAMLPAVIMALLSQSSTLPFLSGVLFALVVTGVWVGIQNVEAIFLVPRVMGRRLNLHPVVVIIAVITGATVAGIVGIILAAPFTATVRLLAQYLYGKIFDTNPFPPPEPYIEPTPGLMIRFYHAMRHVAYSKSRKIRLRTGNSSLPSTEKSPTPSSTEEEVSF